MSAQGFIRVNELSAQGLGRSFASSPAFKNKEQPKLAEAIVKLRDGKDGRSFESIKDLVNRVNVYGNSIGLDGKRRLHHVKSLVEKLHNAHEQGNILF